MNHYSDSTANQAMGAVDREIKQMRKCAGQIRLRWQKGLLTPEELAEARKQFVGIYGRLLRGALAD